MEGLPGAGEMGKQAGGLLEVPQVLLPLAGIGGLDPGSVVGPGTQAAGVLMWDLVGAGAGGCQLGVQGLKGAAGPVGVGAAATEVPGVVGLGPAVEGHLRGREKEFTCESQQVMVRGLPEGRCPGSWPPRLPCGGGRC